MCPGSLANIDFLNQNATITARKFNFATYCDDFKYTIGDYKINAVQANVMSNEYELSKISHYQEMYERMMMMTGGGGILMIFIMMMLATTLQTNGAENKRLDQIRP